MARKGYAAELQAKHELQKEFGNNNVIKVAIGGAQDYIIASQGKIIKIIEVKECHAKKYYPHPKEVAQFERIKSFAKGHGIKAELWVKYPRKDFVKMSFVN